MLGWYNNRRARRPMQPRAAGQPWFVLRRFVRRFIRTFILIWVLLIVGAWVGAPMALTYLSISPRTWTTLKQWGAPIDTDQHTLQILDPRDLPFPAEAVAFRTPDGLMLRGWFGRASATAPVILLGHGYPGNREFMIPHATMLYQAGYSVLLFDWRSMGESEGGRVTFGLHETDDLRGAIDYLEARPDLTPPPNRGAGGLDGRGRDADRRGPGAPHPRGRLRQHLSVSRATVPPVG